MSLSCCKIKLLSLLFCAVFIASPLKAKEIPEFRGAYGGELVWQGEVTMLGDVLILEGGKLTIKAGTKVNVFPAEGTKIDPEYLSSQTELLVRGHLDIQGTAEEPVRFVILERDDLDEIAWSGITLDHSSGSYIDSVVLERADIGIRCVNSSPDIIGSRIVDCRYGIVAQHQSHPRIVGNTLERGEAGVFCWGRSNPYLLDNLIVGHDEEAIFVDASSRPKFDRNTVRNNSIGLALYPRDLNFTAVTTTENSENIRWLGSQGQEGAL